MQRKPTKKSILIRTIREVLLLGISVALIYMILAPDEENRFRPVTIADLKGVWVTSHPDYRDRFLQFTDGVVTFGWGTAGIGSYTIDDMDSEPEENGARVRIRYHDMESTDYRINFHYSDHGEATIRMKNGLWSRTNDQPTYDHEFK